MLVFLYEYTCAAGSPSLAPSLRAEGWAMLSAVVRDFEQVPGVDTCTILAADVTPQPAFLRCVCHAGEEATVFRRLAAQADYTLVIAPECDDLLATRCQWVVDAGGRLLGPTPEAVRLTGDKLALAQHLQDRAIPTPPVLRGVWSSNGRWVFPSTATFPAVCKPRYGAGSQATFLVHSREELDACAVQAASEMGPAELLLQPFVPGWAAGVAFLIGPDQVVPLMPAAQHLSEDGRFRYLGGTVPLPAELCPRAVDLGRRAVEVVPGLRGYVGVDLVLGDAADGSQDIVIEINPRLTTSYIGLRRLARLNLAQAMLQVVRGESLDSPDWRDGPVHFRAHK